MLIAGEASGDLLAAELVQALRLELAAVQSQPTDDVQPRRTNLAPRFFGAGGARMGANGVELSFDTTQHSVIGLSGTLKNYFKFRRLFHQLLTLAIERQPDAIIGVDFSLFNRRFAHAIHRYVQSRLDQFHPWNPKLIQYVSPQVWASRPTRAYQMAEDLDLLLSIFPFELAWYAKRVPKLRVEFVGHPLAERYTMDDSRFGNAQTQGASIGNHPPQIILLPGSRTDELRRHLPVMLAALERIQAEETGTRAAMILPDESLARQARSLGLPTDMQAQVGGLPETLIQADLAIASTGTVTMECAYFGVPTVALYKTTWTNYEIGKRIVTVKHLAMPNLLANESVFPEFIQQAATPENISRTALELLRDPTRRQAVKARLANIIASLGGPGASARAAAAIVRLLQ
jgi:lipid-A-disaccharide synthase